MEILPMEYDAKQIPKTSLSSGKQARQAQSQHTKNSGVFKRHKLHDRHQKPHGSKQSVHQTKIVPKGDDIKDGGDRTSVHIT
jgi:hypothetical protein